MSVKSNEKLQPMTVDEINLLTARARALPPSGDQTYVLVADGEDPWVISHRGIYYYCTADRQKRRILVSKFDSLKEMATAPLTEVWTGVEDGAPEYIEIWSPELQFLDGKWYIYFALYNGKIGEERMYVIEAISANPQGQYIFKGKLAGSTEHWAIDGSVLEMSGGGKYFVWSGWDGLINTSQNIYIAEMSNPWTIVSDRSCISRPEYDWEKHGYPYVNEGPQPLSRGGRTFIIYSASGSWTDDYCLGQLTYLGGDPLEPASWRKEPEPVFKKTDTIFAPGHCSFVKDKTGQDWIIYHAARSSGAGWARQVRAKPFKWKKNGSPDFGKPL
ncbi:MAG TPA: glycoside hydrolase family 43 protein [Pyrinomonadaceae bacterium]